MATDTAWAPWYIADSNSKKRVRLNIISHILNLIPYERIPHKKVKLPKREKKGDYKESNYPYKYVPNDY